MTWPGAIIKKPGEGMPNYDDNTARGNLYITIDVDFPRGTFSDDDKEGVCVCVWCVCTCACACMCMLSCMWKPGIRWQNVFSLSVIAQI